VRDILPQVEDDVDRNAPRIGRQSEIHAVKAVMLSAEGLAYTMAGQEFAGYPGGGTVICMSQTGCGRAPKGQQDQQQG
jgi:hypothetical protein